MDVTILGSGTLVPDDDHRSAAHLVRAEGALVLMDCGSGTVHGMARHRVPWRRLSHLVLSHFHTDHVGDVPALLWAFRHGAPGRTAPLRVVGPGGTRGLLEVMARAFGPFVLDPGFPVEVIEVSPGVPWTEPDGRFELGVHATVHTEESVAFRLEAGLGTVGYTGDAGPDPDLFRFFRGSDVLISECCTPDPPSMDTHLTPSGVARMGREAQPGILVTTHVYPPLDPARVPALVSEAGYGGRVLAGRDGLTLDLGA